MLTEKEAKTKWCPFARQLVSIESDGNVRGPVAATSANRFMEKGQMAGCIASACMAWRFEGADSHDAKVEAWEDAANIGGPIVRGPCPDPVGYCGLAGVPA